MREYKFRGWNNLHNQMVYEFDGYSMDHQNGQFVIGYDDHNNDWQELEVMQYTGLKDKNGKEAYEGDIVKVLNKGNGHDEHHVITFEDGSFCFREIGTVSFGRAVTIRDSMSMAANAGVDFEFEIISNIHETK